MSRYFKLGEPKKYPPKEYRQVCIKHWKQGLRMIYWDIRFFFRLPDRTYKPMVQCSKEESAFMEVIFQTPAMCMHDIEKSRGTQ